MVGCSSGISSVIPLAQRDEPVTVAEDGFYLLQLMRIVRSEQNLSLHDVTLRTCGSL